MWHSVLACAESELRSWPPTVLVRRCHSTDVLQRVSENTGIIRISGAASLPLDPDAMEILAAAVRRPRRQLTEFGSRAHLGQPLPFVRLPTVAAQSWPQTPHRDHAFQPDPAPSAVGSIPRFRVG